VIGVFHTLLAGNAGQRVPGSTVPTSAVVDRARTRTIADVPSRAGTSIRVRVLPEAGHAAAAADASTDVDTAIATSQI
jgi:hypothetical protein